jgi:hypothetical protein
MRPVLEDGAEHLWAAPTWGDRAKVIFTRAVLSPGSDPRGLAIVLRTIKRTPLVEVAVDLKNWLVVKVEDPYPGGRYGNLPLPVF